MQNQVQNRKANYFHGNPKNSNLPYEDGARPVSHLFRALKYGLIAFVPLAAVQAAITAYALVDLNGYFALFSPGPMADVSLRNTIIAISIIYRLDYVFCIIVTSWFLFRAARNLNTVAPEQLGTSPHFAWLWFFIPFANFYKPYESVAAIDRVTKQTVGATKDASDLILAWWLCFISSIFIGATDVSLPIANLYQIMLAADVLSGGLAIAAAVLFIRVAQEISENQELLKHGGVAHVFD